MKTIHRITVFTGDKFFCSIEMHKKCNHDIKKLKNFIRRILSLILKNKSIDIDITYSEKP